MNVGHAYADAIIENVKVLLVGFRDPYWGLLHFLFLTYITLGLEKVKE